MTDRADILNRLWKALEHDPKLYGEVADGWGAAVRAATPDMAGEVAEKLSVRISAAEALCPNVVYIPVPTALAKAALAALEDHND